MFYFSAGINYSTIQFFEKYACNLKFSILAYVHPLTQVKITMTKQQQQQKSTTVAP